MIYPKKSIAQLILNACDTNNINTIVISPGSRNAAMNIGFYNHPKMETLSIVDERSACFFALGIAQQTQKPVALVCTSGSALLNYYPAIAEAYYSNIPLIILSADRPKYLQNIGDGQTINQKNVFKNHILMSADLIKNNNDKTDFSIHNFNLVHKTMQKAITKSGPVHINIPFDEPLYETTSTPILFPKIEPNEKTTLLDEDPLNVDELSVFSEQWNNSKRKMVLIGVNFPSELIQTQMDHILKDESVLVLTETTSNIYHEKIINGIDKLITPLTKKELENLKPDILLTFGGMVVSKKIKQFLRNHQPKNHWHVDKFKAPDTFFCLSHHFKVSASLFFSQFFFLTKNTNSDYQKKFLAIYGTRKEKHTQFLKTAAFSDLKALDLTLKSIPKNCNVQLSNSSIIRYSQLFDIKDSLSVFCNRGTSGIDGSTSTAVGASFASDKKTVFITGDISFFYDSNGLWNNYIKKDFRIILINNSGGGIFRFIPGPQTTNALDLFETPHQLSASHLCKMYGLSYTTASTIEETTKKLKSFFNTSTKPKLFEITTPRELNDLVLKEYFKFLK